MGKCFVIEMRDHNGFWVADRRNDLSTGFCWRDVTYSSPEEAGAAWARLIQVGWSAARLRIAEREV